VPERPATAAAAAPDSGSACLAGAAAADRSAGTEDDEPGGGDDGTDLASGAPAADPDVTTAPAGAVPAADGGWVPPWPRSATNSTRATATVAATPAMARPALAMIPTPLPAGD
jgi:hypothetical protein